MGHRPPATARWEMTPMPTARAEVASPPARTFLLSLHAATSNLSGDPVVLARAQAIAPADLWSGRSRRAGHVGQVTSGRSRRAATSATTRGLASFAGTTSGHSPFEQVHPLLDGNGHAGRRILNRLPRP